MSSERQQPEVIDDGSLSAAIGAALATAGIPRELHGKPDRRGHWRVLPTSSFVAWFGKGWPDLTAAAVSRAAYRLRTIACFLAWRTAAYQRFRAGLCRGSGRGLYASWRRTRQTHVPREETTRAWRQTLLAGGPLALAHDGRVRSGRHRLVLPAWLRSAVLRALARGGSLAAIRRGLRSDRRARGMERWPSLRWFQKEFGSAVQLAALRRRGHTG